MAFHLGDSGYNGIISAAWGGSSSFEGFGNMDVLSRILVSDRAIHDTIATLITHGVFTRHPTLRVASVENGSDWIHCWSSGCASRPTRRRGSIPDDPLDTVRQHVWATPYCEEDLRALADLIGADRILFGSDWPHGEGLADPVDFVQELGGFSDDEVRRIMRDNCLELLGAAV